MSANNTQLSSAASFDVKNMIFSEPVVGNIPDSKPAISFKRVMISTRNDDGSTGELILPTEEVFTYGVSENLDQKSGEVNGYVLPLCLHSKSGATAAEQKFVEVFNAIVDRCKDYLLTNKEKVELYDLEPNDLKKFNPIYYKKDKGKIIDGAIPTLYGKLITSKKSGIVTKFYDANTGEQLNAMELLGCYGTAVAAIKFESIFIGSKVSLQVKVYECDIKPQSSGMKRLLRRPAPQQEVRVETKASIPASDDSDDDAGSLVYKESPKTPEKKKPVRNVKTVKKPAAKPVVSKASDDEDDD